MKKLRVVRTETWWPIDSFDRTPIHITYYEAPKPVRLSWFVALIMASVFLGIAGVVFLFVL